ncbi:MAG: S8 family serine peptidase [Myxococcota bacterium]
MCHARFPLCIVFAAVLGTACFEIDEPTVDAGPPGATLNGRILVDASITAQRASRLNAEARAREALHRLQRGETVTATQLDEVNRDQSIHPRRRPLPEETKPTPAPLEWRPAEAIVLFEKGLYDDKGAVRRGLDAVMQRATRSEGLLPALIPSVTSCTARHFCLVRFEGSNGKLLDNEETTRVVNALHAHRGKEFLVVARNFVKRAFAQFPNDPYFGYQWHYEFAKLPAAWDISVGDDALIVAVVDSGLKQQHPDILGRVVQGADLISEESISGDGNGRDPDPEDPGDQALGQGQSSWHGTHVAGTVAANTNNSLGVAGVLWKGRVQPVRVLGLGAQGTDFDILSGVYWAVGDTAVEDVPRNETPAKVINLSLGGPADAQGNQVWTEVLTKITDTEKDSYGRPIFITAAGNSNETVANIVPANIPGVITVGATRYDGRRAAYSNWGAAVDVMAPGGQLNLDLDYDGQPDGVLSLYDSGYDFEQGTSMAAPHVSGIAGLLASVVPDLDQATAQQILRTTANPAGVCSEGCGTGHVDALEALLSAGGVTRDEPLLAVDVTRLIYQPTEARKEVLVLNLGNAPLTFTTEIVGSQRDLWQVTPSQGTVAAASVQTISVALSRGSYTSGSANLEFIGSGAAVNQVARVDLFFNDAAAPVQADINVARVEAWRVRPTSNFELEFIADTLATRQGDFTWRLTDVPPGKYFVFAVGDDDNDGEFNAQRESFGAWPLSSDPTPFDVGAGQTITGIDFGLSSSFVVDGTGGVGAACGSDFDCSFAADAECILAWPQGYCTRQCDDGYCGAGGSCELLECGAGVDCNVCLTACVNDGQCRSEDGYVCDMFGTCAPSGF